MEIAGAVADPENYKYSWTGLLDEAIESLLYASPDVYVNIQILANIRPRDIPFA